MLRTSGPPAKPEIKRVIDELLKEDKLYDQAENRSAHRENLVRHIAIMLRQPSQGDGKPKLLSGFSRNISATGVGLITDFKVEGNAIALLTIDRLGVNSKPATILSECRWCRPYGENWFLSGWQFVNLKR